MQGLPKVNTFAPSGAAVRRWVGGWGTWGASAPLPPSGGQAERTRCRRQVRATHTPPPDFPPSVRFRDERCEGRAAPARREAPRAPVSSLREERYRTTEPHRPMQEPEQRGDEASRRQRRRSRHAGEARRERSLRDRATEHHRRGRNRRATPRPGCFAVLHPEISGLTLGGWVGRERWGALCPPMRPLPAGRGARHPCGAPYLVVCASRADSARALRNF